MAAWLTAEKAKRWRGADLATARIGDVTREIADDPTTITIIRAGVSQAAQTVRLLIPGSRGGEAASAGGEQAEADLILLGTSAFDVQRADRFEVSSEWYEVVYVAPEQPSSGERVEAHCRQMQ
jgi:head-tail adaptor